MKMNDNYQQAAIHWNAWEWSRKYPVRGVSYIKDHVRMDFKQAVRIVQELRKDEQLKLF